MFIKFRRHAKKVYKEQKGMTGLETAIILIAFVTVASVLSYSVLSAGIFSAEKSKQTVYSGLAQAQGTLEVKGQVTGYSSDKARLDSVTLNLGLVDPSETVDSGSIVITFFDQTMSQQLSSANFTLAKLPGSPERGTVNTIERDEVWQLTVTLPVASDVGPNDWFVLQILPPKGAGLNIKRTMPGYLDTYFTMN